MLDWLLAQVADFSNPQKRIFWGYLLSALLMAFFWLCVCRGHSIKASIVALFAKKIWLSRSSLADFGVFFFNKIIMAVIAPKLLTQITVATFLFYYLHEWFGSGGIWSATPLEASIVFTTVFFMVDDFSRFYVHRLLHKIPCLWRFHKVHHSAEVLTPLTVFRTHPVEGVLFFLRSVVVQGVVISLCIFLYGDAIELWSIWGASVFVVIFNSIGSNLRHSHIAIRYGRVLEHFLISPAQHQIHHSVAPEHYDKNFGVVFSVWDWLWGSLHLSKPNERLRFGLAEGQRHHLAWLYFSPLIGEKSVNTIANYYHLSYCATKCFLNRQVGCYMNRVIVGSLIAMVFVGSAYGAKEVNVYSARKTELIEPLLDRFSEQTGIKVNLITGDADALLTRLRLEGKSTPADVFITVDAGRLQRAKEAGVLQSIKSDSLLASVPEQLRDKDNQWFGLSSRARVIFYVKGKVDPSELSTYQDLASEKWQGRLCVRSSNNIYNQSLVSAMIEHDGEEKTEAWAKGLVKNFARRPAGGDTDQLKAAAVGVCDLALANTYYYGRLLNSTEASEREVAEKLGLFWPNQDGVGAHVNVSGAGVTASAKNKDNAIALLEFLISPTAQTWYAEVNNEFPVVVGAKTSDTLKSMGEFKADSLPLNILGENNRRAVELMDRANWK